MCLPQDGTFVSLYVSLPPSTPHLLLFLLFPHRAHKRASPCRTSDVVLGVVQLSSFVAGLPPSSARRDPELQEAWVPG